MKHWLWVIDLSYASRLHHGGVLRYFNLSRELVRQGHQVTFAIGFEGDRERCKEWLETLRADGVFTDYCEIELDPAVPQWRRLASVLLPFNLHALAIRPFLRQASAVIEEAMAKHPADVVIISSRRLLFAACQIQTRPLIGDFTDSITLYSWRELMHHPGRAAISGLIHFFFLETFSSRKYAANIIVSPVDKRVFDWIGTPSKNVCIENGVRPGAARGAVAKCPEQMIFSGAMDFPPNYESALWFLDRVLPLVLAKRPHAMFVIAGANPDPKLLERAGPNVTVSGFVPDLGRLLAQSSLYVAPLITGSGFKNKVVEAIANGTYVIGTTFSSEFLDPAIQNLLTIVDDPRKMADAICEFLAHPEQFDNKLDRLQEIVVQRFSWPAKAEELVHLASSIAKR